MFIYKKLLVKHLAIGRYKYKYYKYIFMCVYVYVCVLIHVIKSILYFGEVTEII